MKASTMLDSITSLLGMPACAIPLSSCHIRRAYLLERAGIPLHGTAILFAIPYVMTSDAAVGSRNISLYAVPCDYHGYMKHLSDTLLPILENTFPGNRFALFSDHSPIAEADAAARAGLGVLGMNGLLITPTYGSFVFIGEIVTDADFEAVTGTSTPQIADTPPRCEACGACIRACPARKDGIFTSPCLSELTQKKGDLSPEEAAQLADHPLIWGCDTCQTVCPRNIRVIREKRDTPIPYFRENRHLTLNVKALDSMSDPDFAMRAFSWRGRAVIRRNANLQATDMQRKEESEP